jgi:hypothetical protein
MSGGKVRVIKWRHAELALSKPEPDVRRTGERCQIVDRSFGTRSLEPMVMGNNPRRQVAAVAPPDNTHSVWVEAWRYR